MLCCSVQMGGPLMVLKLGSALLFVLLDSVLTTMSMCGQVMSALTSATNHRQASLAFRRSVHVGRDALPSSRSPAWHSAPVLAQAVQANRATARDFLSSRQSTSSRTSGGRSSAQPLESICSPAPAGVEHGKLVEPGPSPTMQIFSAHDSTRACSCMHW